MFFYIEPEVAGGLGSATIMDGSVHPPVVSELNLNFEGWLGDELLEAFPCFVVTKRVEQAILESSLTGVNFSSLLITFSGNFTEMNSCLQVPEFSWMKVIGMAGVDDFGLAEDLRLVVSEKGKKF